MKGNSRKYSLVNTTFLIPMREVGSFTISVTVGTREYEDRGPI